MLAQFVDARGEPRRIEANDPEFPIAVEAIRDFRLLEFIFDNWPHTRGSDAERQHLVGINKDSALPQSDEQNSPGRDQQAELLVGAMCRANRLEPVRFAEPDVRATVAGIEFGIAVKRAKSATRIRRLVASAAEQIARSGGRGIVVLDISRAYNRDNAWVHTHCTDATFKNRHAIAVKRLFRRLEPETQDIVRGRGVRGILVVDHQLRHDESKAWSVETLTMAIDTSRGNARRHREFEQIERGLLLPP